MSNPLCSVYFFSDSYVDSPGDFLDLSKVLRRIEMAICQYETVKGFSFKRETSKDVTYGKAMDVLDGAVSQRTLYPNAAIVRYDGYVMGAHLANGTTVYRNY
jgi:hypothetical protein